MNKNEVLKNIFGYDEFREGQAQLVDALLAGRDAFGIMPTGAGKSICYQVPALMLPGITLVISPLISLMKDQVAALNQAGVRAAFLNSSLTYRQYLKALDNARNGLYKIIYVAPERLITDNFMDFALSGNISFISIDEAHCISHWGQDFRPSYTAIADFIDQLSVRPVVGAFTATATEKVEEDVIDKLKLKNPLIIKTGFDRKNLRFMVKVPKDKYKDIRLYLREHSEESGVIYCITRKAVEEVCDQLNKDGFPQPAIMPDFLMKNVNRIKKISSTIIKKSLWLLMHSVWGSINQMFVLLFITICLKILRATIRKQDEPEETVYLLNAFCFTAAVMLLPINFSLNKIAKMNF